MSCRQMTNILKQTLRGLINNARMIIFAGTKMLFIYPSIYCGTPRIFAEDLPWCMSKSLIIARYFLEEVPSGFFEFRSGCTFLAQTWSPHLRSFGRVGKVSLLRWLRLISIEGFLDMYHGSSEKQVNIMVYKYSNHLPWLSLFRWQIKDVILAHLWTISIYFYHNLWTSCKACLSEQQ